MEAIKVSCRACERVLLLTEIPKLGTGACPTCGAMLAPGYTHLLLQEARRAEVLQRDLAACLRRLSELPGNLVLDRDAVYAALAAELPVEEQLAADRALIDAESRTLRRAVRQWQRLRHRERAHVTPGLVARFRALAQRVRLLNASDHDAEHAVLREAEQAVNEAADAIRRERLHAEMKAAAALDDVLAGKGGDR